MNLKKELQKFQKATNPFLKDKITEKHIDTFLKQTSRKIIPMGKLRYFLVCYVAMIGIEKSKIILNSQQPSPSMSYNNMLVKFHGFPPEYYLAVNIKKASGGISPVILSIYEFNNETEFLQYQMVPVKKG